jgi:hypothetical protein
LQHLVTLTAAKVAIARTLRKSGGGRPRVNGTVTIYPADFADDRRRPQCRAHRRKRGKAAAQVSGGRIRLLRRNGRRVEGVRGDDIAGLLVVLINVIGGMVIGIVQQGLTFAEAAHTYTLLTVGDGLSPRFPR